LIAHAQGTKGNERSPITAIAHYKQAAARKQKETHLASIAHLPVACPLIRMPSHEGQKKLTRNAGSGNASLFSSGTMGGFRLADRSTRLIRDALCRAAAEPDGAALIASKSEPGLFPSTATAKAAAERCKEEGYVRVVRTESKGKLIREICAITEKGRHYLVRNSSPREVLEDFVRALEGRQADVQRLADAVMKMQQGLQGMQSVVAEILPRLSEPNSESQNGSNYASTNMNGRAVLLAPPPPSASTATETLIAEVKAKLSEWHAAAGASEDCPLPELYRRLETAGQTSIGQFHDCLRQLHDDQMIYLHPWTGPLYALPEPAFALLVGHEIAYYGSIR
jgi:hypothetical protein